MSRAMAIREFGPADVLEMIDLPQPEPAAGQVRVSVRAAGVNLVDCRIRAGVMQAIYPATFPQVLGNEFAGVVDGLGDGVSGFAVGDEVIGFAMMQCYAESIVVPVDQIVGKPAATPWDQAGALSAAGQTAWTALAALGVEAGQTLLVHAAAGGVGSMAVQLARHRGATVIGTAGPGNQDYLREIGAIPVEYGDGLADRVRELAPGGVDVALDAHGGPEALDVSLELVAEPRRIGTIANFGAARFGVTGIRSQRSVATLAELARLTAEGALHVHVQEAFGLERAADAHRLAEGGHVRGKLVLVV